MSKYYLYYIHKEEQKKRKTFGFLREGRGKIFLSVGSGT